MALAKRSNRKDEILQALALMLENNPGQRITTAALADAVGVSEAALYRHFPSKARMFEGLLEFTETTLQDKFTAVQQQPDAMIERLGMLLQVILMFAERNPGICRLLTGEALQGEQERLRERVTQLFERIETELRTCLRDGKRRPSKRQEQQEEATAALLLALCEGKIHQFVRTGFKRSPLSQYELHWATLKTTISQQLQTEHTSASLRAAVG